MSRRSQKWPMTLVSVRKRTSTVIIRNGGYDDGYRACPCFWGKKPGSLVVKFLKDNSIEGKRVFDAGCGEGKNAAVLSKLGAKVTAIDYSNVALRNAQIAFGDCDVNWHHGDVRSFDTLDEEFDLIIAYGLLHCLPSKDEIDATVRLLQGLTASGGCNIVCTFNDRGHDLSAHPGFNPCLVSHSAYLELYEDWTITFSSDEDLHETHPHNNIPHVHSMTRLIARKA